MTQATIHEAKTHLSKLIRKALAGEEVVIAKRDQPLVRLEVVKPPQPAKRELGWAKGAGFYMSEDFNAPLEEFAEYMCTEAELRQRRRKKRR